MKWSDVLSMREKREKWLVSLMAILLVVIVSVVKYRPDEVNYLNANATWHTLLTIEAYDETPISTHLFLPIVSLGEDDDKFVIWGDTIPDKKGNYYYTSFSPAGYFVPWLFIKLLRLNVCESSLYIFNSFLFAISAMLWSVFIFEVFETQKDRICISVIGALTYVLTPELLHGMGIVYWHQSLMQVTLLVQTIAFWKAKKTDAKSAKILFYIFAFLNPYIEWTGYVANIGFALAELMIGYNENIKKALKKAIVLGMLTTASSVTFIGHYLLRVEAHSLFRTLKDRFLARNFTTWVKLTSMFGSYLDSFLFLWVLLIILVIWNIKKKQEIELKHGMLMFILVFPVFENILVKHHVMEYSYDKMKVCFILSFLTCELAHQLLFDSENRKVTTIIIFTCVLVTGVLNVKSYMNDRSYIWETSYQAENKEIAAYVNNNYPNAILGIENRPIRGYMNLLFERSIYEFTNADDLKDTAIRKGKQYAIILDVEDPGAWEVYNLGGATVYDVRNGKTTKIIESSGVITTTVVDLDGTPIYQLSSRTDKEWTAGYSNTADILLFTYDTDLLIQLLQGNNIVCSGELFPIEDINYDDQWIKVSVSTDASVCKYPNYIQIK